MRSTTADKKPLTDRQLLGRMLRLAYQYRWECALLLVLQSLLMMTAILAVQLGGFGIDWVEFRLNSSKPIFPSQPPTIYGLSPPSDWGAGWQMGWIGVAIVLVALARSVLNAFYMIENGRLINQKMVVDLRIAVYAKMQQLSFRFFDANASSTIINRLTGDIHATRSFVDGVIIQLTVLVLSLICYIVAMLRIHPGLTLACLATTPVMWWMTSRFTKQIRPEYDKNRELFDAMTLIVAENSEGQQTVKAFGRQSAEIQKYCEACYAVQKQQQGIFWKVSVYTPLVQFLTNINLVILLAYGGILVTQGKLSIGSGLVVFAGLLQQFSGQVTALSGITNTIQQSLAGARRVFEVLDTPVEITSPQQNAYHPEAIRGAIEFENVDFGYGTDQPVLKQIQLTIPTGKTIAILGEVGAGKSTLMSLIPRFYDPTHGRILIDGVDLREWDLTTLRKSIGIVFQETFLFSNSIAANLAFGHPEATREEIERAAKIAHAHEFVSKLPQGYDTILGEFGLTLSGGQRQRLAIARALVGDPPILLLDDPAAAIDPETEQEILISLQSSLQGRTSLMIAHRLSTLRAADGVVVLQAGRIVQRGTHAELLNENGTYREVALSQGF